MASPRRLRVSPAAWARRVERHALHLHPALLKEAQHNSRTMADASLLLALAREIALTRGPELTLGYRNVVMVQPGFKKSGSGKDDEPTLTREPCVVFVVRRKWDRSRDQDPADPQRLPSWLVSFGEVDGRRLPFAVRTDVQPASDFSTAQAHSAGSLWLQPPGSNWEHGTVACAVLLQSDAGTQRCLLSAMHVFSPAVETTQQQCQGGNYARPMDPAGARLAQPVVANSLDVGGVLRGDEDATNPSFDVQLAQITDLTTAQAVLGALRLSASEPWIASLDRLLQLPVDTGFQLLVPDNNGEPLNRGPLAALLDAPLALPFPLRYRLRRNGQPVWVSVYHDELLKLTITGAHEATAGDSGCAVVLPGPDGGVTLAGMYIGGDGRQGYAIPSWRLFDMRCWATYPAGSQVHPVSL